MKTIHPLAYLFEVISGTECYGKYSNMDMMYSFLFSSKSILWLVFFAASCKGTQDISKIQTNKFEFLTVAEAKTSILTDAKDLFFERVGVLDMKLQMTDGTETSDRELVLAKYQEHLENSIMNFTTEDKELLSSTLDSCFTLIRNRFPKLRIPSLSLIKINANHYGPSVYYTRERNILIPFDALEGGSIGSLLPVMLHEISHILLRYESELKKDLYGTIGFKKLDLPVRYSPEISKRLLFNPDGLDDGFFIQLNKEGDNNQAMALPVLVSNKSQVSPNIMGFMNYIQFDLYQLITQGDHYLVESNKNGFTTLGPLYMSSFFEQVKENTQYIIHPDEIIADNFMMLLITKRDNTFENFSEEGQELLEKIETILQNY